MPTKGAAAMIRNQSLWNSLLLAGLLAQGCSKSDSDAKSTPSPASPDASPAPAPAAPASSPSGTSGSTSFNVTDVAPLITLASPVGTVSVALGLTDGDSDGKDLDSEDPRKAK